MLLNPNDDNNLALDRYEAMLKSNRVLFFDSNEFENIVHYYLDNGKLNKAKKAVAMGLSQHPSSVSLKLLEVEILVFDEKLDKAEKMLDSIQNLEPENEEVYIQKASICSKRNKHEKAIEYLKFTLSFCQEPADIHALLGMEYLFMDDFEHAKKHFSTCLKLDPSDYSSLYNTINCFNFLEQTEEAIEFLNEYLDINPYCEVAWHQLGKQYQEQKELKKALAAFDFAIISDDTFVGAYIEKAKILERLKKYNEAIENYSITLELEDPTSFALLRIGRCFEKLKIDEKALYYYKKTVHEDPLLDKGWIAITNFYIRKKDYNKALYYINKATDIDGENVDYWKHYAKINYRLQKFEEAEFGFRRALEYGDTELNIWLQRADVLLKLGETEATINCLDQANELYPENAEINFRLAGIYYTNAMNAKAKKALKSALNKDSEYFIILEELFPQIAKTENVQKMYLEQKKSS